MSAWASRLRAESREGETGGGSDRNLRGPRGGRKDETTQKRGGGGCPVAC